MNVAKHADAKRVQIAMQRRVKLTVESAAGLGTRVAVNAPLLLDPVC